MVGGIREYEVKKLRGLGWVLGEVLGGFVEGEIVDLLVWQMKRKEGSSERKG